MLKNIFPNSLEAAKLRDFSQKRTNLKYCNPGTFCSPLCQIRLCPQLSSN